MTAAIPIGPAILITEVHEKQPAVADALATELADMAHVGQVVCDGSIDEIACNCRCASAVALRAHLTTTPELH
jgi:hypothetical protein